MFSVLLLILVSGIAQTKWQLPVKIQVMRDVEVQNGESSRGQQRGTLYIGRSLKPFVIQKGETFEMIQVGQEGGCRIRFEKRDYDLSSCPWLDGFRDHQTDVFQIVTKNKQSTN